VPRRKAKARQENEGTANHSWTASPKSRGRSLVCSKTTGRKGLHAVRRSLSSRNYKNVGIHRQEEDQLIQIVRINQHSIKSAQLQTVKYLQTEVDRKDSTA